MASQRAVVFMNGYIYHLFNRGVERRPIFFTVRDRERFVSLIEYYRFSQVTKSYSHYLKLSLPDQAAYRQILVKKPTNVDVLAYCLMPNHFHIAVKQNIEHGIHLFLSNIANGYTKYLNTKRKRVGPLYQGPFKAVLVETDEQLTHLSRYIHLNPVISGVISLKTLDTYPWSSFPDYLGYTHKTFVKLQPVRGYFKNIQSYREFVYDQVEFAKEREKVKHLTLEEV